VTVQRLILGILASAAAFGLLPAQVQAGTFGISPLRADLSARSQTGALTIRNQESAPVVVQAEVLLWEQADGQDRLSPTRDVLVSPAVFTIPGDGSQLVRVALRRPADAQRELSYRLILTEVPQQASPGFTGLNVALRLSLPVFVAPMTPADPRLEWSAARDAGGGLAITARNAGNAHARVLNFNVLPATGSTPGVAQDVAAYILPGQARTWTLDNKHNEAISGTDWHRLRVKGTTEAGDFELEIRPEGP
jgi:fimbrial chaperone protein